MAVSRQAGKPRGRRSGHRRSLRATLWQNHALTQRPAVFVVDAVAIRRLSSGVVFRHDDSDRIFPMKKLVLSVAAVALLAGFAAGCAQPQKPAPAVTRKG
jgi:hypothetical protein